MTLLLIDDVRTYLRIDVSDTAYDVEIQDLIDAAQADLIAVGIKADWADPLIKKAITTYCKAHFGYDTDSAEKFLSSYEKLKIFMMNNASYQAGEVV